MAESNFDVLDLMPKRRTTVGDLCRCCLPQPPKFSPVYNLESSGAKFDFSSKLSLAQTIAMEEDDDRPVDGTQLAQLCTLVETL